MVSNELAGCLVRSAIRNRGSTFVVFEAEQSLSPSQFGILWHGLYEMLERMQLRCRPVLLHCGMKVNFINSRVHAERGDVQAWADTEEDAEQLLQLIDQINEWTSPNKEEADEAKR